VPGEKDVISFDVEKLPSIPQVLLKLIEKCQQVDISFNELADIVQMDAALTAKVIATASSSTHARLIETKDFSRLVAELGVNTIRAIATTSAVHLFFSRHDEQADSIVEQCWRNSLTTAHIARLLARVTGYPSEDDAYAAGLLHNVGQLLLLKKSPVDYLEIVTKRQANAAFEEQNRFGITAIEAGAKLVGQWQPDSFLEDAVRYQHAAVSAILDAPHLIKLTNLACKLCERTQSMEQLTHDGQLLFSLSHLQLADLLDKVDNEVRQSSERLWIAQTVTASECEAGVQLQSEQLNLELARQVRNVALLDGVRQHLDAGCDLENMLQIVCQDLSILFGLSRSLCFLYNGEHNQLVATGTHNYRQHEFLIPVEQGRSLLADSILQQKSSFSLGGAPHVSLMVIDQQLIRLLGGEGMLCMPLITDQKIIGVLAAGITEQCLPELKCQQNLISNFANEVARGIQRWRQLQEEQQQLLAIERARQQEHTGKLLHEAYNPLSIINNYLQLLAGKLDEDHAAQLQLAVLKEEVERVTGILLRMKNQPQTDNVPQGEVDLNMLIQDLFSIFRSSLFTSHDIQDVVTLDKNLPLVLGNRNSLKQIVTNLVKNAVEAMPDGGLIKLNTRGQVNVNGVLFVELMISDTGQGMTNGTIKNLFKPITSTKGSNNAGLGLSIVNKLVTDMRGTICCRSNAGGGAEFQVLLPMKNV